MFIESLLIGISDYLLWLLLSTWFRECCGVASCYLYIIQNSGKIKKHKLRPIDIFPFWLTSASPLLSGRLWMFIESLLIGISDYFLWLLLSTWPRECSGVANCHLYIIQNSGKMKKHKLRPTDVFPFWVTSATLLLSGCI